MSHEVSQYYDLTAKRVHIDRAPLGFRPDLHREALHKGSAHAGFLRIRRRNDDELVDPTLDPLGMLFSPAAAQRRLLAHNGSLPR